MKPWAEKFYKSRAWQEERDRQLMQAIREIQRRQEEKALPFWSYKEIQIDYSSTLEASEAINILSENFKKEDMWAEITGENIITLYINQVDFNKLKN